MSSVACRLFVIVIRPDSVVCGSCYRLVFPAMVLTSVAIRGGGSVSGAFLRSVGSVVVMWVTRVIIRVVASCGACEWCDSPVVSIAGGAQRLWGVRGW